MGEAVTMEPWKTYDRARLWRGISYPVGATEIRRALNEAEVEVGSVRLLIPRGMASAAAVTDLRILVAMTWSGDLSVHNAFDPAQARSCLDLFAVPSTLRQVLRDQLRTSGLPRVVDWLRRAVDRGDGWTASDHSLALWYSEVGAVRVVES